MSAGPVNGSSEMPVKHLVSLLGDDVVLLRVNLGEKGPRWRGWQNTTIEMMQNERYLNALNKSNIAVLTGEPSGGLCSIDIDDDEAVEPFLALNPTLRETLRSHGRRGCNVWVRITGAYPPPSDIKKADGSAWGEWRSSGVCTMIHGVHPKGMSYTRSPEVSPVTMHFGEIQWPDDLILPWLAPDDELPGQGDESDDPIIQRYGVPVFFSKPDKEGTCYVKGINEAYWAGLYAAEHIVLYEPDEQTFFRYHTDTGVYAVISADAIKDAISYRMLEVSRKNESMRLLENMRTERNLNSITSRLKGIVEHRKAFTDRPRAVHLANCMLTLENGEFTPTAYSPDFRSRNRSPISYDPTANCPRFLNELLLPAVHPDDAIMLQKMAGLTLLGENLIQRFVILDGEPGRGKSQYGIVLQHLVGRENVAQLRTRHLDERFEVFRYLRRTFLVGVDVDADFLSSKGASTIKGLVGGDLMDAEQKGGNDVFQIEGKFNMLMTSNCRLKVKLQGDVGAWRRRMLIARYELPPPKVKIPNFGELLIREEGPGILNWALNGLRMLLKDIEETGDIRLTPRQSGVVDSLLAESDSLRYFLRECVKHEKGSDLTVGEIVQAYAHYCPDKGWDPLPESRIGSQLGTLMLELFQTAKSNSCQRDGRATRGYRGVTFINPDILP
jgi:P4 family phage/plasmid primase-like protien